ncbi:cupin domain-containing protein [Paraburkholderia strydomiana]|uniref:cupin domain-containing protein n=1 Tax=Paraburkholderia strydomiana TaxID=1245417 RepID=UPI002866451A|nr:cupin domain-containing protein [Paraburkholderia strydomiana]MDR7006186.1 quercetin dioxygenase-like cupin family protein [Paraburkholderia strydomiana]
MPHTLFRGLFAGLLAGCCLNQAYAANAAADLPNSERTVSTVLLRSDHSWDGTRYKSYPAGQPQLTMLKIAIPAHTALPWHTHPMPNAAYVISGTLNVESRDGRHKKTLHAGDTLPEMVGISHRGVTGDAPVELIVFYAGVKNMPTAMKSQ